MAVALAEDEALRPQATDSRRHMPSRALIPEHLAVSIMEEWQEAFPPVGSRALAEASTGVEVSTVVEAVAADSIQLVETRLMIWRKKSCAQMI